MTKYRILHVVRPREGGVARYARTLSSGLEQCADSQFDSRLLTPENCEDASVANKAAELANRAASRAYRAVQRGVYHRTNRFGEYPLATRLAECDLLHLHQVNNWLGLDSILGACPRGTPIVVTLHDMWWIAGGCVLYEGCDEYRRRCSPCPLFVPPFNRIAARVNLRRKVAAFADRRVTFVANSEWTAARAWGSTVLPEGAEIRVAPPVVDSEVFRPMDKTEARRQFGVPEDAFIIGAGCASITDENKNIAAVFELADRIETPRPVLVLVFGEGELPGPQRAAALFAGPVADAARLRELYCASDVFLSTSRMESYGMTLIEALACETPVVAYATGAVPEAAPHGEAALLAELDDLAELTRLVQWIYDEPELGRSLGAAGRRLVSRRNTRDALVTVYVQAYQALLAERGCAVG